MTAEEKRKWLTDNGYDPNSYELVDESAPKSSIGETLKAVKPVFARNIVPALAGVAAAGRAATLFPHPAMKLAGGLVAGGAASIGARLAQEEVLKKAQGEEGYELGKEAERKSYEEHPTAAAIAELAPDLLTFKLAPTRQLGGLLGLGRKGDFTSAIKYLGPQAGIPAGIEAGRQLAMGEPLDLERIGIYGLGGGLLTRPTRIGARIMGVPPEMPKIPESIVPEDLRSRDTPAYKAEYGKYKTLYEEYTKNPTPENQARLFELDYQSGGNFVRNLREEIDKAAEAANIAKEEAGKIKPGEKGTPEPGLHRTVYGTSEESDGIFGRVMQGEDSTVGEAANFLRYRNLHDEAVRVSAVKHIQDKYGLAPEAATDVVSRALTKIDDYGTTLKSEFHKRYANELAVLKRIYPEGQFDWFDSADEVRRAAAWNYERKLIRFGVPLVESRLGNVSEGMDHLRAIWDEELLHAALAKAVDEERISSKSPIDAKEYHDRRLADVWNSLTNIQKASVADSYFRTDVTAVDPVLGGYEFVRALMQANRSGITNEALFAVNPETKTIFRRIVDYLRDLYNKVKGDDTLAPTVRRLLDDAQGIYDKARVETGQKYLVEQQMELQKNYAETGSKEVGTKTPPESKETPDQETLRKYQVELENSIKDAHGYSLPYTAAWHVARKNPELAQNMTKYFDSVRKWSGAFTNKAMRPIYDELSPLEWLRQRSTDMDTAVQYLRENYGTANKVWGLSREERARVAMKLEDLSPRAQRFVKAIQASMADVRAQANLRKDLMGGEFHMFYSPDRLDPDKVKLMARPEGVKLREAYKERAFEYYLKKEGDVNKANQMAEEDVSRVIETYTRVDNSTKLNKQFGPLDRSASYGAPDELLMDNKLSMIESYFNRAGKRLAYYDNLEGTDYEKAAQSREWMEDKNFRVMANRIDGEMVYGGPVGEKLSSLVRSSWLGALTGLRDIPSSFALNFGHATTGQMARGLMHVYKNAKRGMDRAYMSGLTRDNIAAIESGLNGVEKGMQRASRALTAIQGRQAAENLSRQWGFLLNEFLALDNLKYYKRAGGDLRKLSGARKYFIEKFGEDAFQRALKKGSFSEQDLLNVARRAGEASQATYGPGGLPAWAMEGWTAPFAALSRFSIEQTLRTADILSKQGLPAFFRLVAAGTLAGEGIRQMTNLITGREPTEASLDELRAAKEKGWDTFGPIAYRMTNDLSAAAFGGLLTDFVRNFANHIYGGEVLWDNFSFPAVEIMLGLKDDLADMTEATIQGELDADDFLTLIDRTAVNNIQGIRLLLRNFPSSEQYHRQQRAKETQEYRRYQMLAPGMRPPQRQEIRPNLYMNEDVREFQQLPFNSPRKWELAAKINQRAMSLPFDRGQAMLRSARTRQWRGGPADELNLMRYLMFKQKADGASSLQPLMQSKMQNDLTRQLVQSAIFPPMR